MVKVWVRTLLGEVTDVPGGMDVKVGGGTAVVGTEVDRMDVGSCVAGAPHPVNKVNTKLTSTIRLSKI